MRKNFVFFFVAFMIKVKLDHLILVTYTLGQAGKLLHL